jgi:glutaredoxin
MNKFALVVIIATVAIFGLGVYFFSAKQYKQEILNSYEYYWSSTCPHCKNVADFMESWDKKDSIVIEKMEVNQSAPNAQKLIQRGNLCKLSPNEVGTVPLLVTPEGKCYLGDAPIIDFLKSL